MECIDGVKAFFTNKVAAVRSLLSIPPRSESMAGVIILYVFTNSIATSVWMFNSWTPYIYLTFGKSNWHVGLMSAVNGVFELSTAFISGYLADRVLGPSRTLRYAVMFGVFTLSTVLVGIWTDKTWLLVFAQMCEGTYMGFSFTCLESVFAQCMGKGERDRLYSIKFAFEAAGPIVGLVVTITLFLLVGDEWKKTILRNVMTAGLALHLGSMVTFLCTFVPVPCHLDRKRGATSPTAASSPKSVSERGRRSTYQGKATGVVVTADSVPGEVYESEDPRMSFEEDIESELPPLYLSRRTEMINQARTAVLQARSFLPRLAGAYEPSVCTAQEGKRGGGGDGSEDDGDGAASQAVNSQSFFSAGGKASTRFAGGDLDVLSEPNADGNGGAGSFREARESSDGADAERSSRGKADLASPSQKPRRTLDDAENGRKIVGYIDTEYDNASQCRKSLMDCIPLERYPVMMVLADMVLIVGSGMTTQYFSLFMMEIYGIQPVVLTSLGLINSFIISFLAIVNGVIGKRFGRVRAQLPSKYLGSLILLYMALSRERKTIDGSPPMVHPAKRVIMCICYVVRNAFMNCSAGLSRALIMDLVSEHNRGRWNALESVQSAGWSGTALIGGIVADHFGYGTSFLVTFAFHFFSCVMLTPLTVRNDSKLPIPIYSDETTAAAAVTSKSDGAKSRESACSVVMGETADSVAVRESASTRQGEPKVVALTVANVMRIASSAALLPDHALDHTASDEKDTSSRASGSDTPSNKQERQG